MQCPTCGLYNPDSALWCDCGYDFQTRTIRQSNANTLSSPRPVTAEGIAESPHVEGAARWAWRLALISASISAIMIVFSLSKGGSPFDAINQAFSVAMGAFILVNLAISVRRGDRWAAWGLVIFQTLNILYFIIDYRSGILIPLAFLYIYIKGALYLNRTRMNTSHSGASTRTIYQLAFFQAAWIATFTLLSKSVGYVAMSFYVSQNISTYNLWSVIDIIILVVLGIAIIKRQLWAAYLLVTYQLISLAIMAKNLSSVEDIIVPTSILMIYGLGALHMRRIYGFMEIRYKIVFGIMISVILGLAALNVPAIFRSQSPRVHLTNEMLRRFSDTPGLSEKVINAGERADQVIYELTRMGVKRLSEVQLIERARILAILLSFMDDYECATQARGKGKVGEALLSALGKLDELSQRAWYDIVFNVIIAEHQNSLPGIPPPSDEAVEAAMLAIVASLPDEDADRFTRIGNSGDNDFEGVSDSDMCWFFRTLLHSVPRLSPTHQRTIARLLAEG